MTVDWDQEKKINHQNSPKRQEKRQEWKWKKGTGKEKLQHNQNRRKANTRDKSTKPSWSTQRKEPTYKFFDKVEAGGKVNVRTNQRA